MTPRREKRRGRRTKAHTSVPSKAISGPAFPPIEQKLIALVLDPAAAKGEIVNGAVKLVEAWRRRGLTAGELLRPLKNGNSSAERVSQAAKRDDFAQYGDVIMPMGKHKGLRVSQVWKTAPDYLYWSADAWELQSPKVADAIRRFLKAAEYREASDACQEGARE